MGRRTMRAGAADQQEIDLLELLTFYMSKWPLLIAAAFCGALLSGLFTHFFIADRYTAVSRMYMVSASSSSVIDLADLNIGTSLSNDYVELMKTRPVIEGVIDSLGLDYTYEDVSGMISLSVVPNTRIVRIAVTSTDPQQAMDIANAMARVSRTQLPKVMDAPTPSIAEEAILPEYRSYPSMSRNTAMGGLAALLAVMGVLTGIFLLDDTIKTSEDFEKEFGIMPLAVIPEGTIEGLVKSADDKPVRHFRIPRLAMGRRMEARQLHTYSTARPARIPVLRQELPVPGGLPVLEAGPMKETYPGQELADVFTRPAEAGPGPAFSENPPRSAFTEPAAAFPETSPYGTFTEPAEAGAHASPAGTSAQAAVDASADDWRVVDKWEPIGTSENDILAAFGEPAQDPAAAAGSPQTTPDQPEIIHPETVQAVSQQPEVIQSEVMQTGSQQPEAVQAVSQPETIPTAQEAQSTDPAAAAAIVPAVPVPAVPAVPVQQPVHRHRKKHHRHGRAYEIQRTILGTGKKRKRREKILDFAIGTVFLLCAGLLIGLLLGQASAPVAKPSNSSGTPQVPVVVSQSASPQGAAGGATKNYTQIVVFMDNMQHVVEERYTAQDGSVVLNEKGYAIVRNEYDAAGHLTRTSYFDQNDRPVMVPELGYSSISITYDGFGNKIGETYYDTDGSPVARP